MLIPFSDRRRHVNGRQCLRHAALCERDPPHSISLGRRASASPPLVIAYARTMRAHADRADVGPTERQDEAIRQLMAGRTDVSARERS